MRRPPHRDHKRSRRLLVATLALGGLLALPAGLPGVPGSAPAPAAADTTDLTLQGTINHTNSGNYAGAGPKEQYSSPGVADITGDNTPEIVVANMDGTVEAFRSTDRTRIWTRKIGNTSIQSSPTLADLGGDGKADVIVGTMDGRVVWLDGPTGKLVRTYRQGAPQYCPAGQDCRPDGFFASPAVADINGDRIPDIIAPSYDHSVYAWSRGGTLLFRRFLEDTLWSSPVVTDIDRDGKLEIVLGGDIYAGNNLGVASGGLVWVLRRDGSTYPGYPKSLPGQTVWSSPAVADINGDKWPDIVVGTGANWPEPAGRKVYAFTARNRANHSGWPVSVDGQVMASPAIGDIDGDGALEVSFASNYGWVYAYEANGSRKWRTCNGYDANACRSGYTTKGGTIIADVDGDGIQEVISALDKDIRVYDGRNGATESTYRMNSTRTFASGSSPAVAEVDGKAIVVMSTVYMMGNHSWPPAAGDITKVYVMTSNTGLCRNDWSAFQRDAARRGTWTSSYDGWIPFDCPADFVSQQYADFLGRAPDGPGSAYWTSRLHKGMSGSRVIRSFLDSNEFGVAIAPIVRSYLSVQGTYPTTTATIIDSLEDRRQGATLAEITEAYAADPTVAARSDEEFVTSVYQYVYKRPPSYLEVGAGVDQLANGTTRGEFASGHAETAIGQSRLSAEVTVAMVYLGMLGRSPDPSGWGYWVPRAAPADVNRLVTGFQRSVEYDQRVN